MKKDIIAALSQLVDDNQLALGNLKDAEDFLKKSNLPSLSNDLDNIQKEFNQKFNVEGQFENQETEALDAIISLAGQCLNAVAKDHKYENLANQMNLISKYIKTNLV